MKKLRDLIATSIAVLRSIETHPRKTLQKGYAWVPRAVLGGVQFLMSEVPLLHTPESSRHVPKQSCSNLRCESDRRPPPKVLILNTRPATSCVALLEIVSIVIGFAEKLHCAFWRGWHQVAELGLEHGQLLVVQRRVWR